MKNNFSAKTIMIQGTASHVGKSVLTAALCRIFKELGYKTAPFKSQNMALNSSVTLEGGEIGRAQAFQAEAAGVEPTIDMNPVLLKPTGESTSQVVVHGRVHSKMSAKDYHLFKREAMGYVMESFARLASSYDVIIIEGAGSPAEVNLRESDIVNMALALETRSPVLLAGDIDRGGVLAAIVGTMELLTDEERAMIKGFIINKFRGDPALLSSGLDMLHARTGKPVLGVVPYVPGLTLPDEDGVAIEGGRAGVNKERSLKVSVVRLPRISNFTDFDPLISEPGVTLSFIAGRGALKELLCSDLVIIPGTKNVIDDLLWLRENGFEEALAAHLGAGGKLMGICGGFQMLGSSISDPHGVEGAERAERALGLLSMETVLTREKETYRVSASVLNGPGAGENVSGYEIHMGRTVGTEAPFATIGERNASPASVEDGAVSRDGLVTGTYIHGIFDNDAWRGAMLKALGADAGEREASFGELREASIKRLSEVVASSLDMEAVREVMGLGAGAPVVAR